MEESDGLQISRNFTTKCICLRKIFICNKFCGVAQYPVVVNNFGIKPAHCIATSSLHSSADEYAPIYPVESREVKEQTYINDGLTAAQNKTKIVYLYR